MGKCNCGAKPVIEAEEKIQNELILDNREKIQHIKKQMKQNNYSMEQPNNNLIVYLLFASILIIIILLITRKCQST